MKTALTFFGSVYKEKFCWKTLLWVEEKVPFTCE